MDIDPLKGRMLGAYRIESLLGEGGMARVYKGFHERLQRRVAIKVIHSQQAATSTLQRYFEQEAQLVARLQHRNIVTVYDFGEDQDMLYLVMQYVAGGTLRDQLQDGRPLEPRRAAIYALQMARALHHAHQRGIIHRDVKPLNMLVSGENRNELLLSDFGLAKIFAAGAPGQDEPGSPGKGTDDQVLSRVGSITGTPRYMAPEQCLGKLLDARTDIYALGVVLFEMLSGQPPFRSASFYDLLRQHAYVPAPSLTTLNAAVPEPLISLTSKALAKRPEDRFQSARELATILEDWLTPSAPVVTPQISAPLTPMPAAQTTLPPFPAALTPAPPFSPPPAPTRRRRKIPVARIMSVLFSLVVIAVLVWQLGLVRLPVMGTTIGPNGASTQNGICVASQSLQPARAFVDNFQDNGRGWPLVNDGNIAPSINAHTYALSIANNSGAFFLCPDTSRVGTLPGAFTLSADIAQKQGPDTAFYGLAFYLHAPEGDGTKAGYVFAIDSQGDCALFKYDPQAPRGYALLSQVQHFAAIHKQPASNVLQVNARANTFTFTVNNTAVPFQTAGQEAHSVSDSSYSSGLLGILVSGPNTNYAVTRVALALPS